MKLQLLTVPFSICKLTDLSQVCWDDEFVFLSKTDSELSLVCDSAHVPPGATAINNHWRAFKIQGVLDFSLVGILARISTILAEKQISIFAISTFDTDYILVKEEALSSAVEALHSAGHETISV